MTADVQERAQVALLVAHDHDRDAGEVAGEERAGLCDLVGAARVLPGAPEDPLLLQPQHGRVGVPVERDRAAVGDRRHAAILGGDGHRLGADLGDEHRSPRAEVGDQRLLVPRAGDDALPAAEVLEPVEVAARDARQPGFRHPGEELRPVEELEAVDTRRELRVAREAPCEPAGIEAGSSSNGCAATSAAPAWTAFSIATSIPQSTETKLRARAQPRARTERIGVVVGELEAGNDQQAVAAGPLRLRSISARYGRDSRR